MVERNGSGPGEKDGALGFILALRAEHRMPISLIQADEQTDRIDLKPGGDVDASLAALTSQKGVYRRVESAGHSIIYPRKGEWDTPILEVRITDVPRLQAATQYVALVRARIPALKDLLGPPMKGNPNSPVYTQPVSLQAEGAIVQHFAELLGSEKRLVFTVERVISGARILYFDQVPDEK
jgi:hypothetical protein